MYRAFYNNKMKVWEITGGSLGDHVLSFEQALARTSLAGTKGAIIEIHFITAVHGLVIPPDVNLPVSVLRELGVGLIRALPKPSGRLMRLRPDGGVSRAPR